MEDHSLPNSYARVFLEFVGRNNHSTVDFRMPVICISVCIICSLKVYESTQKPSPIAVSILGSLTGPLPQKYSNPSVDTEAICGLFVFLYLVLHTVGGVVVFMDKGAGDGTILTCPPIPAVRVVSNLNIILS